MACLADRELAGRAALVTGSARGIGRWIAQALASAGADVAVNYKEDRAAAEATAQAIATCGVRSVVLRGDCARPADVDAIVAGTTAAFGRLDILVNNVGEFALKAVSAHAPEEFERILAGTVGATFYATKAALPWMRRQGWGRVVNLGAAGAEHAWGRRNIGPHLAGKAAVVSLTRTLALEEGRSGVTFNVVSPGVIEDRDLTPTAAAALTDRRAPVGRPGTSEDVARAVLFLCSPRSGFINGAVVAVTGGWQG